MKTHVERTARAIRIAIYERGVTSPFRCAELGAYGAPNPMLVGHVIRWHLGELARAANCTLRLVVIDGRHYVEVREDHGMPACQGRIRGSMG